MSKDHVHHLVLAQPHISPSDIIRKVEGRSSAKLLESCPGLKKRYWAHHFWAREYFCVTSGEIIKEYLDHYFEVKDNDNFRAED